MLLAAASEDVALAFIELGLIALGLAVLARMSDRLGVSPIPAYLVAGLLFGEGGIATPELSSDFLRLAAQIGIVLLLLTLGLEYTADELRDGLRRSGRAGTVDLFLNALPGAAAAFLLIKPGFVTDAAGLGLLAVILAMQWGFQRRTAPGNA